jgi:hypothetical protein
MQECLGAWPQLRDSAYRGRCRGAVLVVAFGLVPVGAVLDAVARLAPSVVFRCGARAAGSPSPGLASQR